MKWSIIFICSLVFIFSCKDKEKQKELELRERTIQLKDELIDEKLNELDSILNAQKTQKVESPTISESKEVENKRKNKHDSNNSSTYTLGEDMTDKEIKDKIIETLNTKYECDDKEDLNCILDHFEYPLKRYFHIFDVNRSRLKQEFEKTFSQKVFSHKHEIDWNNSRWDKIKDGYKVFVTGKYIYIKMEDGNIEERAIKDVIFLNKNFKITSINR